MSPLKWSSVTIPWEKLLLDVSYTTLALFAQITSSHFFAMICSDKRQVQHCQLSVCWSSLLRATFKAEIKWKLTQPLEKKTRLFPIAVMSRVFLSCPSIPFSLKVFAWQKALWRFLNLCKVNRYFITWLFFEWTPPTQALKFKTWIWFDITESGNGWA